jgi:hypothetical protein
MFARSKPRPDPEQADPVLDTSKRFDIYMTEHQTGLVVLRNVKIIGKCRLFPGGNQFDVFDKFIELEQLDGSRVFVSRHSMVRLAEHGTEVKAELLKPAS